MTMKELLTEVVDTMVPVIEERTTLIIDVTASDDEEAKVYTYAALYVGGDWYVTGQDRLLSSKYSSTNDLMFALGRLSNVKIELVTTTETVRG